VLVGWGSLADSVFSSGAGTIRYSSDTPLQVTTREALLSPTQRVEIGEVTGETSNSTYGTLPAGTSTIYEQSFGISTTGSKVGAPVQGHARPSRFA
jgi:hypothetical protein